MELYISLESVTKALKKFRDCRLDTFLVHAAAQSFDGAFSSEAITSLLGISKGKVSAVLKRSQFIKSDGENLIKRARLNSIYDGAVVEFKDGELMPVSLKDAYSPDILVRDPVIDYSLSVLKKYGNILSLLDMTILFAIQEKNHTEAQLLDRLDYDECAVLFALDNLKKQDLLSVKNIDGVNNYFMSAKSSDIWSLMYKQTV